MMTQQPATPLLDLSRVKIDPGTALRLAANLALRRQILPLYISDGQIFVACANPKDTAALQAVERTFGKRVVAQAAEPAALRRVIEEVYRMSADPPAAHGQTGAATSPTEDGDPEGAVALTNELLHAAIIRQASDIHLDPSRHELHVRFRVDGVLEVSRTLPRAVHAAIISRLKVMAGMDIAEKRSPQDGGFAYRWGSSAQPRTVDIRAATLPTRYGERMTLRLLGLQTAQFTLERLGMSSGDFAWVEQVMQRPHGLVLLTGPTGSGKTTTLYAMVRQLAAQEPLNIVTVEDPIEYEIAGVAQVEVEAGDKVSFGKALRSILRHDPDVLMIGEIRDRETLDIATKASLTGHLVLSTLHTNSAPSAITRMRDMGAEPYLLAATLRLVVAQRLVRRLCQQPGCRKSRCLTAAEAAALGLTDTEHHDVHEPGGCVYCAGRGYEGRVGLFEVMPIDEDLSARISANAGEAELSAELRRRGHQTLRDDAAAKVRAGLITAREALAAVNYF